MAGMAGPIVGAAGSVLGGFLSSRAANKAGKLLGRTGIDIAHSLEKATSEGTQAIYTGMANARTDLTQKQQDAAAALSGNYGEANRAIANAVTGANQTIGQGVTDANAALNDYYAQQMGFLSPYMAAGQKGLDQLQAFMAGPGAKQFDASMMEANDPGYAFRIAQGQQALERSAAARGGVLGAAQSKAMDRYTQDYASNEYQNAWQRYMAQQQQQFGMLNTLAGYGAGATQQAVNAAANQGGRVAQNIMGGAGAQGGNIMQGGGWQGQNWANLGGQLAGESMSVGQQLANQQYGGGQALANFGMQGTEAAGNAYWQGAQAQAAAMMASGNAWAQGLGGAANSIAAGLMMKPPSSAYLPGVASDMGTGLSPWQNYASVPGFGGSGGLSIPGLSQYTNYWTGGDMPTMPGAS